MAAANARIGVARAAYYPSIILGPGFGEPNAGWQSNALASLVRRRRAGCGRSGLSATQTLFDAGKTRANVRIANADYTAAVATYRQTVLTAMEEVENGITGLASLDRAVTPADASVKSAQDALRYCDRPLQGRRGHLSGNDHRASKPCSAISARPCRFMASSSPPRCTW